MWWVCRSARAWGSAATTRVNQIADSAVFNHKSDLCSLKRFETHVGKWGVSYWTPQAPGGWKAWSTRHIFNIQVGKNARGSEGT